MIRVDPSPFFLEALAKLLREAETAHKEYEKAYKLPGHDVTQVEWPEFYAQFMLQHLGRLWP